MGRVPEDGDGPARIKGELVMAGDLDQLSWLDGLAAAGLDRERQDSGLLRIGLGHDGKVKPNNDS
jgi:hypothetical protein